MNATARIALLVALALALALVANLVLLGIANGPKDPVGQLSPRAGIVELPAPASTTAPVTTRKQTPTVPAPSPVPPPRGGDGSRGSHEDD